MAERNDRNPELGDSDAARSSGGTSHDHMWDGWILEGDGSIHAASAIDQAVLPTPNGVLLRFHYSYSDADLRAGRVRSVQLRLDEDQVSQLAVELLDYRNKRQHRRAS